jgi:hypothetical protein
VIREPREIAINYLKGTFIIDFLAFFPFYNVISSLMSHDPDEQNRNEMYHYINLFFLLRLLRLYKAAELLDPHYIFAIFRNFHGSYIEYRIRNNHKDKNLFLHQLEMFKVGYLIIRLLMMLVCLSYFVGLLWYIYVKVIEQITFDMMGDEK